MIEELPQGSILCEKYRILSLIGRGAWSRVYLAKDLEGVGTFWAIKEITTHGMSREDAQAMTASFLQEGRILAGTSHEGLPRIHDFFKMGTAHYLVLEWIAGQTLLTLMEERGSTFPVSEVIGWGIDICRILAYLHSLQPPVIVGDLKPGNIMRTFDGKLKMVDFGVARYLQATRIDRSYTFVTPGFSPPEQYGTLHIDARSDLYALGATLYYLMTGADMDRFKFQIPPLRRLVPEASAMVEDVVASCLQTNRNLRPSDASLLRRKLQGALEAERPQQQKDANQARDILASLYHTKRKEGFRASLDEDGRTTP